jgi:hypothetical protein
VKPGILRKLGPKEEMRLFTGAAMDCAFVSCDYSNLLLPVPPLTPNFSTLHLPAPQVFYSAPASYLPGQFWHPSYIRKVVRRSATIALSSRFESSVLGAKT